ncbi:hypothetical protein BP6252_00761 [Coleophoma cylindrospora]|uniref:Uncharacterized protein n=1 Tax=Coleophoma cylindrospora TaxID=1849047 RepID=A0A3D8SQZ6_9HELO|nr:hypothetical protein BP6252_00761 [Coleophoma cylindrospora]
MDRLPTFYDAVTFLLVRVRKLIIRSIVQFRRISKLFRSFWQQYYTNSPIRLLIGHRKKPQPTTIAHTQSGHLAMSDWQAEYLHFQHLLRIGPRIEFTSDRARSIPRTSSRKPQQIVTPRPFRLSNGGNYAWLGFLVAVLAIMYIETRAMLNRAQDRLEIEMERVKGLEEELHRRNLDLEKGENLRRSRLKNLQVALKRKEEEFDRSWDSAKELLHRKKGLCTDGCADIGMSADVELETRTSSDAFSYDSLGSVG